jgi:ubiquinone/menaquinone biosynthesis C-methylase UbiE
MQYDSQQPTHKKETFAMTQLNADATHQLVQEYYGDKARRQESCCGDGCCSSTPNVSLYPAEELALAPADAAGFSLGCGNPTAIASLKPGEVVVDLGSGGGLDVFLAATKVGPTGFVYGIDMTDDMLALARRNAAKAGVTNVEFRKGHIEALPLPDATADVIISNCVINLSPDKGRTLQDAFRVLRSGGRLAVSDIVIDGTLDDLPVSEEQVRSALHWAGCVAGALTADQFRELLAQAGFVDIDIRVETRFSGDALAGSGQDFGVSPEVLAKLAPRFTSSLVSATKP